MTLNDAILAATGGPTVNDGLRAYYNAHGVPYGTLQDMERAFLRIQMPVAEGSNQDLWMQYLSGVWGYEGTLNDMLYQFWLAGASIGLSWQDMVDLYFSNGENGLIYVLDPAEGCVFQDAAGTTPCTGPDQPVGLVLDVSGNGNHASQSTTTKRPMLRQDGDLWYIQGDGIDDFLSTAEFTFSNAPTITTWLGASQQATIGQFFAFGVDPIGTPSSFGIYSSGNTAYDYYLGAQGATGAQLGLDTYLTYTGTHALTWMITTDVVWSDSTVFKVDAVDAPVGFVVGGGITGGFGSNALTLLARPDGGGGHVFFFSGNLYSLMIRGAETTDLTPGNEYTAQLTGITLP